MTDEEQGYRNALLIIAQAAQVKAWDASAEGESDKLRFLRDFALRLVGGGMKADDEKRLLTPTYTDEDGRQKDAWFTIDPNEVYVGCNSPHESRYLGALRALEGAVIPGGAWRACNTSKAAK